ncbi:hypothetical protein PGTUg99_015990 [Puccinia graminis f. sp. tritici]|uniref:Uncharacterized protein n=1 Tax=Puccinia graminis f. sp. tritici TaxID=56615 RepID=A0A5B0RZG2_PUCGR|nr:hypothetical protein PGTUg99_015990 [Puccinia graminis f. sp. tritici]
MENVKPRYTRVSQTNRKAYIINLNTLNQLNCSPPPLPSLVENFHPLSIELEMVTVNPDIRADADIRSQFQRNLISASATETAGGYPLVLAGIHTRGYPPFKLAARQPAGRVSFQLARCSLTGRASFQSTRYMYLVGQKDFLPAGKVHVPCQLEGSPPTGRKPFQPAISSFRPRVSLGIPGYPPGFHGKGGIRTRQRISPGTGGYPPADSGYPQRIIPAHL